VAFAALVIDLTAKLTNLQSGMDRAVRIAETSAKQIEKSFSFTNLAKGGAGFFAAQLGFESLRAGIVRVKELSDEWTRTRVLVQNVTRGIEEASVAQTRLYKIAQDTRQNYGELTRTFASFARNADQLNISSAEAADLQKTIAQAISLSGARADSAASALVQFGQGISSGVLRGEELNSVLEQTPKLAKAIADGMGVPIGQLIKMGKEGELTADKIITALQTIAPRMQQEFEKVTPTIADAFVAVTNSMGNLFDGINKIIPIADTLASILLGAANAIDKVANMMKLSGANETQRAVNEAKSRREKARILEPFTDEQFLAREFRRRNPGMVVDMDVIRQEAKNFRDQRSQLMQEAAEFEAQLDAGGVGPDGGLVPSLAQADAENARRRQEREVARQQAYAKIFLQNKKISNAFDGDVKLLQEAFKGQNFDDPKVRDDYNKMYRELLERSGFFPKEEKAKKGDDPLAQLLRVAEKKWTELDRMREKVLESIDPLRELRKELEDINRLAAMGEEFGGISEVAAISARATVEAEIEDARKKYEESGAFIGPSYSVTESYRKATASIEEYVESLRIEADLVGTSAVEREALTKMLDLEKVGLERTSAAWGLYKDRIENALKQKRLAELDSAKGAFSDSRTGDIQLLAERLQNQIDEANFFGLGGIEAYQDQFRDAVSSLLDLNKVVKEDTYKLGEAFESAFEKAVTGGESLHDVFAGLAKDVAMLWLRMEITNPMAKAINSMTSGSGGENTLWAQAARFVGGWSGGGSTAATAADILKGGAAPPGFAMGGEVKGGRAHWVGERGIPELFVPETDGRIVTLEQARGPGSAQWLKGLQRRATGGPVDGGEPYMVGERGIREMFIPDQVRAPASRGNNVTVVNNISVTGEVSRADIFNAVAQSEQRVKSTILDSMQRRGAFARG